MAAMSTPSLDGRALFDLVFVAMRHSTSLELLETEIILFTVAAVGLLYVCRFAYRSLRDRRCSRRSRA